MNYQEEERRLLKEDEFRKFYHQYIQRPDKIEYLYQCLDGRAMTITHACNIFTKITNEEQRFQAVLDWVPLIRNLSSCREWFANTVFHSKVLRYRFLREVGALL